MELVANNLFFRSAPDDKMDNINPEVNPEDHLSSAIRDIALLDSEKLFLI